MWGEAREIVRAYACVVEATHVHLLVGPVHEDIARFAGRLKGSTSSALLKHPDNRGRKRIWTAGFWKVFLFDDGALTVVQKYIERHHRHEGEASSGKGLEPHTEESWRHGEVGGSSSSTAVEIAARGRVNDLDRPA
jgi:hypothetical protein